MVGAEGGQGEVESLGKQVPGETQLPLHLEIGGGAVEQPAHITGTCLDGLGVCCAGQQVGEQALVRRPRPPVLQRVRWKGRRKQVDRQLGVVLLLVGGQLVADDGLQQPVQAERVSGGLDQPVSPQRLQRLVQGERIGGELVERVG